VYDAPIPLFGVPQHNGCLSNSKDLSFHIRIKLHAPVRAWMDYTQTTTNAITECVQALFRAILSDDNSLHSSDFLLEPSPEDVRRICAMHQEQHGVAGLLCFVHDGLHAYPAEAFPCCSSREIQEMQKKNKMCAVVVEVAVCGGLQHLFLERNLPVDLPELTMT
jgi:hypothetical protein